MRGQVRSLAWCLQKSRSPSWHEHCIDTDAQLRGYGGEDDEKHSAGEKQKEVCAVTGLTYGEGHRQENGPNRRQTRVGVLRRCALADRPLPAGNLALDVGATHRGLCRGC